VGRQGIREDLKESPSREEKRMIIRPSLTKNDQVQIGLGHQTPPQQEKLADKFAGSRVCANRGFGHTGLKERLSFEISNLASGEQFDNMKNMVKI